MRIRELAFRNLPYPRIAILWCVIGSKAVGNLYLLAVDYFVSSKVNAAIITCDFNAHKAIAFHRLAPPAFQSCLS